MKLLYESEWGGLKVYKPKVKDISIFKEIAKNVVNPLEIIREAISNSYDAQSEVISIILDRNASGSLTIEIQDDGKAMDINSIHSFFNLGDSSIEKLGIGEKGLGTKLYFKSNKITVFTQSSNREAYELIMNNPWQNLCNNKIPEYVVNKIKPRLGNNGTKVLIEGYRIDNPERYYNIETIKDYILWFTAAGSFKTFFSNYKELHKYVDNMQIAPRIFLKDNIMKRQEEIVGGHRFYPPQENPKADYTQYVYKKSSNYCRHFGPFNSETNINGRYVSVQIYGTISGSNCRKENAKLRQGKTLKSRYGVYLAKDFIPFLKDVELIKSPKHYDFHLLINSQAFELTVDRNDISNKNTPEVKWVMKEAKRIIDEDIMPLANEGYFQLRKKEELERALLNKRSKILLRLEEFDKKDDLLLNDIPIVKIPDNESQVVILFTAIMSNPKFSDLIPYIKRIGHYSQRSTTDMICINETNEKVLVEIEYKLSNLFKHEHPYSTFDFIVCWEVDLMVNEQKALKDGNKLLLAFVEGNWMLKFATQKVIPIIELKDILNNYVERRNN